MQAEFEAKKSKEKLTNFEAENEVSLCHFLPNFDFELMKRNSALFSDFVTSASCVPDA